MPEARKGPVGPSSKAESRSTPEQPRSTADKQEAPKERGATAIRGDHVPPGVLEDTKVAATKQEEKRTEAGKRSPATVQARRTLPGKDNFLRGAKREATVEMDPVTGANIVTSDRTKDRLTGETLEVLVEPMEEAEVEEAREHLRQQAASPAPEHESRER